MADSAKLGRGKILQRYRNIIVHPPCCCVYFQPNSRQPAFVMAGQPAFVMAGCTTRVCEQTLALRTSTLLSTFASSVCDVVCTRLLSLLHKCSVGHVHECKQDCWHQWPILEALSPWRCRSISENEMGVKAERLSVRA